ncbi:chitin binding peritrophin-A domain-containing protein [Streptomyces sp. NBC_00239]|uniref:chitin binding peritrophin-A domain-containing protein n=1 Tax=Streptomyces sp. NBC_00239 TaxID=2903640 RepID=UPI002E2B2A74|nr:chitin binding peritrophin-A domain-containing protein [Streptomyces sp. NBC_00239]
MLWTLFRCSQGVVYLKECPSILHFNPVLKVCDWPENAKIPAAGQERALTPADETGARWLATLANQRPESAPRL